MSGPSLPSPPQTEHCYRHPAEETLVHCTRCGRPICPRCMIPAPVGHHCPTCVGEAKAEFRKGAGRRLLVRGFGFTHVFLVLNVAMFIVEIARGGSGAASSPSPRTLIDLGAMNPVLIAHGEYWRLITPMFLHAGLIHIAVNSYSLWVIGRLVERDFGGARFLALYLVSGFLGNVFAFAFSGLEPDPSGLMKLSVGASTAIAGVFGAFFAYYYRRRRSPVGRFFLNQAIGLLLLNLFLGLSISGIDNLGHLGGLLAGAAGGYAADDIVTARHGRTVAVATFALVIGVGIALTAWHVPQVRAAPLFQQVLLFLR